MQRSLRRLVSHRHRLTGGQLLPLASRHSFTHHHSSTSLPPLSLHTVPRRSFTSTSSPSSGGDGDGVPTISVSEFAAAGSSKFDYVVDCREDDEVKHGMIEGAYHIPLGQIVRDMGKPVVQNLKDKRVLVYCRSGKRSGMAVACQYTSLHPTSPPACQRT
jgi:hypothetical protein